MRQQLKTIAIVGLTVGLLAWFLRNADFAAVWGEMTRARPGLLVASVALTACSYVLRALRWQYLLRPVGVVGFGVAFRTTVIGFAASSVLPARAGEVLRPYLLARREGLSATATFATIVVERLLDLAVVLALLAVFLLAFDDVSGRADPRVFEAVRTGGLVAAAGGLAALAVAFGLAGRPAALGRAVLGIRRVFSEGVARRVSRLVESFAHGLGVIRRPGSLVTALLLSVSLWLAIAGGVWMVAEAFRMAIPPSGTLLLLALLVVGVAVPTPGGVGGFHEAFRIGATVFYAVSNERAIGAAIVLHAISFGPVVLAGFVFMLQDGLNLARVRQLAAGPAVDAGEASPADWEAPPASDVRDRGSLS